MPEPSVGKQIFAFLEQLWPYCRSITGPGLRQTFADIKALLPQLEIIERPSGSAALDWEIPPEWTVREAWVKNAQGEKIIDFAQNNLHLVGYSEPFAGRLSLRELREHLYSLPSQPELIPYVTSYYKRRWGFCLSEQQLQSLAEGDYEVLVDSDISPGSLSIAELYLPGESEQEVLFSTYSCHPSMANDQLSGVGLATFLARWQQKQPRRRYSYRFVFLPEIIGSAAYLELRRSALQQKVISAFNLTCVGDERTWSYLPSRKGNTLADKLAQNLLRHYSPAFQSYSWNERGSDESMFCAPGVDLPMVSVMRSKYGCFPEYHTSADRLGETVTAKGLDETFALYQKLIISLERNAYPQALVLGEAQLGKRGLYPDLSIKGSSHSVKALLNVMSYCDGEHDLYDISNRAEVAVLEVIEILDKLAQHQLVAFDQQSGVRHEV